jgi:colicin import membrane protein
MTDRLPGAMTLSVTLHALVAGIALLFGYASNLMKEDTTKVFQIVQGEGDNFAEEFAPALGEPGGIKVDIPEPPAPKPEMVAVPDPTPVTPAPTPPPQKAPPKVPDFKKTIEKKLAVADKKAKAAAKEREEETKKTLSKKEFDELNKKKSGPTPKPAGAPKVAKLDPEGIRKGVVGGNTANKVGGAGGTSLTRDDGSLMDSYYTLLQQRLRAALEKPPGLSDTLVTIVQFRLGADGSLTGARITQSSGSDEFDRAAMAAVAAIKMPPRPDNKSETINLSVRMKDYSEN